jgi:ABC-2 type transport system permease protein
MSLSRIKAILLQEFFIQKDLTVFMDLPFFSIVTIILFGFMSTFLGKIAGSLAAHYFLVGALLWDVIRINQYSTSVEPLWNIWSRNLCNVFITPISLREYFLAQMVSGMIKVVIMLMLEALIVALAFNFNILSLGILNLILLLINLLIFSWSFGMIILGIIFRYGIRLQAIAWGLIAIIQPLSAAFFPLSILPKYLQAIAYLFPTTFIFEAARANISNISTNWSLIGMATGENIIYLVISVWFLNLMFNNSRRRGQFARNEQ